MEQRPGTSSGRPATSSGRPTTSSGAFRRQFPPSAAEPSFTNHHHQQAYPSGVPFTASSAGYGSSEYDQDGAFGHYPPDALYEEDEEDDESSDGGEVFAYLPPTTAEQQLEQEYYNAENPPATTESGLFQFTPGDTHAGVHQVSESDSHYHPPQYPGPDRTPPYPTLNTTASQSTEYSIRLAPSLHRTPSHPPSALLQSRGTQSVASPVPLAPLSPTSPFTPSHPTPPQQSYVPGDTYRMREITSPISPFQPPMTADYALTHRTDQSSPVHPSSGGHASATGRVSITTRSGVSSRSREVHVTLPAGRSSPPSDVEASVLPSPVADVAPSVLHDTHAPVRAAALMPQTPISDIDQLYYDDPSKGYDQQDATESGTQPRKRRRQKTASSVGGVSVEDEYDEYMYDDGYDGDQWAHRPGLVIKDDKGTASSSYDGRSLGALEAGSPHHGHRHSRGMTGHTTASSDLRGTTGNSNGGLGEGQVVNGSYVVGTGGVEDDDEDSPYPEVRASVSNIDDPDMPVLTVRMWVIGIILSLAGAGANTYFNFRYPAPTIVPLVLLLVAHPLGKFLAYTIPIESYLIRLPRSLMVASWKLQGFFTLRKWRRRRQEGDAIALPALKKEEEEVAPWEWELHLNPGPFNIKEHVLIYIMANASIAPAFALNATIVAQHKYNIQLGSGFNFLIVISTQCLGFGLAGMCRRFLVWPASLIWPQNLVACTLLNTLHADDDEGSRGLTRYRFFVIASLTAVVWCFFPSFIFQALSIFSWVCWFKPDNVVVNQLFGVYSGLGMSFLSFDWNQISFIGSPLMVPWWAVVHVFLGFVVVYWFAVPLLYYNNVWHFASFPIMANVPYDRFGDPYNVTRVVDTFDNSFNVTAYNDYSPMYLTINYAMTYFLAFALTTCILTHTALYHGRDLLKGIKRLKTEDDDIHLRLMRYYPEVPDWWYGSIFVFFLLIGIIAIAAYPTDVPVWSLFVAMILPLIYILPGGFIYAYTAQVVSTNLISESLAGLMFPGKPLTNMLFKAYSTQTQAVGILFAQDLKLGHYLKIPPRATFMAQLVAVLTTAVTQVGIQQALFVGIEDICTSGQAAKLTCPHTEVFYSSSAIWGVIGPTRQFGAHALYKPELYALAFGAFIPIPFWLWQRRYPGSWVRNVSTPVFLNGPCSTPPALGINYSSWFTMAFIFQYVVRRRNFRWWSKFNYILSAALDSGTSIGLIVVFLTLQLPRGGTLAINWWGNNVFLNTVDGNNVAYKPGAF